MNKIKELFKQMYENINPTPVLLPKEPKTWYYPAGRPYVEQYKEMLESPHLLIAGTSGSGKSTVLNGILMTAMTIYAPCDAQFILIDPKIVELSQYKKLPHTLEFVTESKDVPNVLERVNDYMHDEYARMERKGIRQSKSAHLFIFIDELADMMISDEKKEIQRLLQRILAKGRAANIHVIACTQAPNRKVIPAELVLNFTNRIALRCLNSIESRQIINQSGAEKLIGYGKAFYLSPKSGITQIEGIPFYSDEEIEDMVSFWVNQDDTKYANIYVPEKKPFWKVAL